MDNEKSIRFTRYWVKNTGWQNTIYQPEDFKEVFHLRSYNGVELFTAIDENSCVYILEGYFDRNIDKEFEDYLSGKITYSEFQKQYEEKDSKINLVPSGYPNISTPLTVLSMTVKYSQECDERTSYIQEMDITAEDNGAGTFFVIKTDRWAIDDWDEFVKIVEDFKKRLL